MTMASTKQELLKRWASLDEELSREEKLEAMSLLDQMMLAEPDEARTLMLRRRRNRLDQRHAEGDEDW